MKLNSSILKSIIISSLVGTVLFLFFLKLVNDQKRTEESSALYSMDQMEKQGVPPIELQTLSGTPFNLSELKGKIVLINFWASWCAPCIDEFPSMIKLLEEFPDKMVLVAVSRDKTKEDIEVFLKSFPKIIRKNAVLLWDKDGALAKEYKIDRLPESFLTDRNLKLLKKIIGTLQWHTPDSVEYIKSL